VVGRESNGADGIGSSGADTDVDVSVLVPVRNEEAHIRSAVAAMRAQRLDGRLEFLFMDGRSEDATRSILEELASEDPRIRVLDNPAQQLVSGLNIGLRAARGRYIVRMDAHTFYSPDYVRHGVERLRRGDVAWVSGPPTPHAVGDWSRRIALALESWLGTGTSAKWPSQGGSGNGAEIELDTSVFGGIWLRDTLEAQGGWDEGWPVNEDSELAARVLEAGGRIVCLPELEARYVPRDSLSGLARQYGRYGLYRAKTALRHPESLRRSHLLAPAVTVAVATAVVGPRPLRVLARAGLAAYGLAVGSASLQVARGRDRGDLAGVWLVFVTMHVSWGAGFLAGCVRFGPPLRALARVVSASGRG
jgi:succinoglycan biosynthesis protein ExoA